MTDLRHAARSSAPPQMIDAARAPKHATVGMTRDEHEERLVYRLRYRVYVHEQGKRPAGVDWERGELTDAIDPWSTLWCARDDDEIVGTVSQTIIGANFDLAHLPSELALETFPRSVTCPLGYSRRFAIAPGYRSTWVLPSLARCTYTHGRQLGAKFDFMTTNPGLVPLFERLGYIRYTATAVQSHEVGLLIPMVLPATDYEHLRNVRSACLSAATAFPEEAEWGAWLRAAHPIIGEYYASDARREEQAWLVSERLRLPFNIAAELVSMSFVHRFPAGTRLLRRGDRVTCAFLAMDGQLSVDNKDGGEPTADCAPDGVAFARATIHCQGETEVLCLPSTGVARLERRYPEYASVVAELLKQAAPDGWRQLMATRSVLTAYSSA